MTETLVLEGDYGFDQFRMAWLDDVVIDAQEATWSLANIGTTLNRYPVLVTDSRDVVLRGGTIDGMVPLDLDWVDAYVNSAAVFSRDTGDVRFEDWRISQAWDGIRVSGGGSAYFEIDRTWMSDIRDDAVENDDGLSGSITNSLFDGVFVGISLTESGTPDRTANIVTLDNVLIRLEAFEYKGEETHQSIFKVAEGVSPSLSIHNSIFAIEVVDHAGYHYQRTAWDSVVDASNNVFLNLSDTLLPDDYPLPPEGFTVLQGQDARDFWTLARAAWIETYGSDAASDAGDGYDDPADIANDSGTEPGVGGLERFYRVIRETFDEATGRDEDAPLAGFAAGEPDEFAFFDALSDDWGF